MSILQLLSSLETVTSLQVLSLLRNASQTAGSMSGQEERDMLFARLFGLKAIIQSNLLFREKPLSSSSAVPGSLKAFEVVLAELLALGEKKSWIRESCWWTLTSLVDSLHSSSVQWKDDAMDTLFSQVYVDDKTWGPEKVAMTLKLQTMHPNKDWDKFCGSRFKIPTNILASPNLSALSRLLKVSMV